MTKTLVPITDEMINRAIDAWTKVDAPGRSRTAIRAALQAALAVPEPEEEIVVSAGIIGAAAKELRPYLDSKWLGAEQIAYQVLRAASNERRKEEAEKAKPHEHVWQREDSNFAQAILEAAYNRAHIAKSFCSCGATKTETITEPRK